MENTCPNCQTNLDDILNKSILTVFNIADPYGCRREQYCSSQCIESKIRNAPKTANEFFPSIISEKIILGFYQSKSGEYAVIVDL